MTPCIHRRAERPPGESEYLNMAAKTRSARSPFLVTPKGADPSLSLARTDLDQEEYRLSFASSSYPNHPLARSVSAWFARREESEEREEKLEHIKDWGVIEKDTFSETVSLVLKLWKHRDQWSEQSTKWRNKKGLNRHANWYNIHWNNIIIFRRQLSRCLR